MKSDSRNQDREIFAKRRHPSKVKFEYFLGAIETFSLTARLIALCLETSANPDSQLSTQFRWSISRYRGTKAPKALKISTGLS